MCNGSVYSSNNWSSGSLMLAILCVRLNQPGVFWVMNAIFRSLWIIFNLVVLSCASVLSRVTHTCNEFHGRYWPIDGDNKQADPVELDWQTLQHGPHLSESHKIELSNHIVCIVDEITMIKKGSNSAKVRPDRLFRQSFHCVRINEQ